MTSHVAGRLYLHAACSRAYFYGPVLLLHLAEALEHAGFERSRAGALGILALFALGLSVSEFPSGVFADWAGRVRAMQISGVIWALAMTLYLWPTQWWLLAIAQLLLGMGAGFLSGSDTALLHHNLERAGRAHEYGTKLAWMRFWNAIGLIAGAAVGGLVWMWWWPGVFVLTAAAQLVGAAAIGGIDEPTRAARTRGYGAVLRAALDRVARDRALGALVIVSSLGVAALSFTTWAIQGQLRDVGRGPMWMGMAMAAWGVLSAASQRLSAWVGRTPQRSGAAWPWLLLTLPAMVGLVAAAHAAGLAMLGTAVLVVTAASFGIYRNAINVQLQTLVNDEIRASVVSLQSWTGSLWYLAIFPLFGWYVDVGGPIDGYGWIAMTLAGVSWPLVILARMAGVWRAGRSTPEARLP